jgi:hypothetical protein
MLNMPLNICIIARSPAGHGIESMSSSSPSVCISQIGSSKTVRSAIISLILSTPSHCRLIYGLGLHLHKCEQYDEGCR